MKKTLTANISGTVFHIEEDAYEALQRYLASIRSQFVGSPGQDEIMADIEARIAELFTERLTGRSQVVTKADVEHVIGIMGQPEDYMGGDEGDSSGPSTATGSQRSYKRLYRDPDDRWVGGVLGGLAAYIGTDPLWLRIPFIALVILGVGSPILIYIIMWILVPVANTAAEKLMMEGEAVTVDNLKKAFEEGGQRVAKEAEELGKRWSSASGSKAAHTMRSNARHAAGSASKVLARIIGAALFLLGIGMGISLIGAAVGGSIFAFDSFDGDRSIEFMELGALLFPSSGQALWFSVALFLVFLIPVLGILTAGLQLMLDLKAPRWLGWSLGPVWLVALVTVIVIGVGLARDFRRNGTMTNTIELQQPTGQVLYLTNLADAEGDQDWNVQYSNGNVNWDFNGLRVSNDSMHGAWARLDVRQSPDTAFHLRVERETQARSTKTSLRRSENITYTYLQQDSLLGLSPWLAFPKEDKIRAQRLLFVVLVPVGKAVHFDPDMGFMLDDVKNVTNTLDREMVGLTWTMTPNGLSSSVRPEDVPDDLFVPAPAAPAAPEAPTAPNNAGGGSLPEVRAFVIPDLFTLLAPR